MTNIKIPNNINNGSCEKFVLWYLFIIPSYDYFISLLKMVISCELSEKYSYL